MSHSLSLAHLPARLLWLLLAATAPVAPSSCSRGGSSSSNVHVPAAPEGCGQATLFVPGPCPLPERHDGSRRDLRDGDLWYFLEDSIGLVTASAAGDAALEILDRLELPGQPAHLAKNGFQGFAIHVRPRVDFDTFEGGTTRDTLEIRAIDFADPGHPAVVDTESVNGTLHAVRSFDSFAYVALTRPTATPESELFLIQSWEITVDGLMLRDEEVVLPFGSTATATTSFVHLADDRRLYVAIADTEQAGTTQIVAYDLSQPDGDVLEGATLSFPGRPITGDAIHEQDRILRVASVDQNAPETMTLRTFRVDAADAIVPLGRHEVDNPGDAHDGRVSFHGEVGTYSPGGSGGGLIVLDLVDPVFPGSAVVPDLEGKQGVVRALGGPWLAAVRSSIDGPEGVSFSAVDISDRSAPFVAATHELEGRRLQITGSGERRSARATPDGNALLLVTELSSPILEARERTLSRFVLDRPGGAWMDDGSIEHLDPVRNLEDAGGDTLVRSDTDLKRLAAAPPLLVQSRRILEREHIDVDASGLVAVAVGRSLGSDANFFTYRPEDDPSFAEPLGELRIDLHPAVVLLDGEFAHVFGASEDDFDLGVQVVDLSDPTVPTLRGALGIPDGRFAAATEATPGWGCGSWSAEPVRPRRIPGTSFLVLQTQEDTTPSQRRLQFIDIRDADAPAPGPSFALPRADFLSSVRVDGNLVCISAYRTISGTPIDRPLVHWSLLRFEMQDSGAVRALAPVPIPGRFLGFVDGTQGYTLDQQWIDEARQIRLRAIRITRGRATVVADRILSGARGQAVMADQRLIVRKEISSSIGSSGARSRGELELLDARVDVALDSIGRLDLPIGPMSLLAAGDHDALLASEIEHCGRGGLVTVDLSGAPRIHQISDEPAQPRGHARSGSAVFVSFADGTVSRLELR